MLSKLIRYCYATDYVDNDYMCADLTTVDACASRLRTNAEMYVMADKFGMGTLMKVAEKKFGAALTDMEALVDCPDADHSLVLDIIPNIYRTTPEDDRGLRDLVVKHVAQC